MASVYENSENTCLDWYIPYLEIHVFPSNFIIPPGNSNDFYSTPWIFPLISLTAGGGLLIFFSGKTLGHTCFPKSTNV